MPGSCSLQDSPRGRANLTQAEVREVKEIKADSGRKRGKWKGGKRSGYTKD